MPSPRTAASPAIRAGDEILTAICRGKTPEVRLSLALDQIQRNSHLAHTLGDEGFAWWEGIYMGMKRVALPLAIFHGTNESAPLES